MDSTVAIGIAGIAASIGGTFGGVYLGARMSKQTARDLARDEREWAERQSVRQRQDEEAMAIDERLIEAVAELPGVAGPVTETGPRIAEARLRVLRAVARGVVFDDPETVERVHALDMAMLIESGHAEMLTLRWQRTPGEPEPTINPWPISVAVGEVREALSCFARHIDPPEAKVPRASELVELSNQDGKDLGLEPVHRLLVERRASPFA